MSRDRGAHKAGPHVLSRNLSDADWKITCSVLQGKTIGPITVVISLSEYSKCWTRGRVRADGPYPCTTPMSVRAPHAQGYCRGIVTRYPPGAVGLACPLPLCQ